MKDLVFDIPLLKEEVTQYLARHQLFRCTLVSKQWNAWFTPVLWRSIDMEIFDSIELGNDPPGSLIQQTEHIRSILTRSDKHLDILPHLPNLLTLRIANIIGQHHDKKVLSIISKSPKLTTVALRISLSFKDRTADLLNKLVLLPALNRLELYFGASVAPEVVKDIVVASGQVETFHLNCEILGVQDHHIQDVRQAIRNMKNNKIKNLVLEMGYRQLESMLTIPLVERCSRLETLRIRTAMYSDTKMIENALVDKKNSLKSFRYEGAIMEDGKIDELLESIGSTGNDINDAYPAAGGIKEIIFNCGFVPTQSFHQILVSHHSKLISLDIKCFMSFPIISTMTILNGLPLLQSFSCNYINLSPRDRELNEIYMLPWTCVNMRTLDITLTALYMTGNQYQSWKGSNGDKITDFIFSQIGRLSKLEELALSSDAHCLSQRRGYLEHLSNLKEIRTLDLREYTKQKSAPSPLNIQWMMDHWPKWDTVHFHYKFISNWNPSDGWKNRRKPLNPTIEAILKKRPCMNITVGKQDISVFT